MEIYMSSLLASLKPYYYYLIGEGIKKIEVRKTYPKADHWDRAVSFYMSKDEKSFAKIPKEFQEKYRKHFGKVGMRFVCDRITTAECGNYAILPKKDICLDAFELLDYADEKTVYGWHITDLVIYDEPKELSEFYVEGDCDCLNCKKCYWFDKGNGFNVEDDCNLAYKGMAEHKSYKPIIRPPQSWCYVEELGV